MITKFVRIENVGKFRSCRARGDVELRRVTLLYADNGRGKSTLCDVLDSLRSGDTSLVLGRATLGASGAPKIELRVGGGAATFADGAWSLKVPDIVLFDAKFIHSNVHLGDHVELDQKRNLHSIIVGETGVALAEKVEELDARIREANSDITRKRAVVQGLAPSGLTLAQFVGLLADSEVDEKIAAANGRLKAAGQAGAISTAVGLTELVLPELPSDFVELLGKSIEDVEARAEELVREHIRAHLLEADESWLARGLALSSGTACPYCGQSVGNVDLVAAYKSKFSPAYKELQGKVAEMDGAVGQIADEVSLLKIEQCIVGNEAAIAFWGQFIEAALPALDKEDVKAKLGSVAVAAVARVKVKATQLLEPLPIGEAVERAQANLKPSADAVADYNRAVVVVNGRIQAKRAEVGTVDASAVRESLARLEAIKLRQSDPAKTACEELSQAEATKTRLAAEKDAARSALDAHATTVFGACQERINGYLEQFGAGFAISRVSGNYVGGRPQSTYHLVINSCEVAIGDGNTSLAVPSFKNTLSAGDKSTLALAFFLSQLEEHPRIAALPALVWLRTVA